MDADHAALAGSTSDAGILLDDLVRDPHQGAAEIVAVEDDPFGLVFHARPFLASLDRVKGTDAIEPSNRSAERRALSGRRDGLSPSLR